MPEILDYSPGLLHYPLSPPPLALFFVVSDFCLPVWTTHWWTLINPDFLILHEGVVTVSTSHSLCPFASLGPEDTRPLLSNKLWNFIDTCLQSRQQRRHVSYRSADKPFTQLSYHFMQSSQIRSYTVGQTITVQMFTAIPETFPIMQSDKDIKIYVWEIYLLYL